MTTAPATPERLPDRPLAISLLLGISGWFAGLFMLGVVGLLLRPDSAAGAGVCGALLLFATWGLFKVDQDGRQIFVAQLGMTLSIAGQCLMLYAITDHRFRLASIAFSALLLQSVLALVMPNRLHRTLSTLFALIAWALTLHFALLGDHRPWGDDAERHLVAWPVALVVWLVSWGPVVAGLWWAIRAEPAWAARGWGAAVRPIVTGLIVGLAFATLASHPFESFSWVGVGSVGGLALWPLLSALGALGAVAAAFALRRRGLMAVCIVAVLLHVAHFYYALGTSLLVKSVLMLAMGAAALLAARLLQSNREAA